MNYTKIFFNFDRIQDEKSQLDSNIGQNIKQEDIDKTLAKLTELNLFEQFKSKKNIGQKIQEPKKVENDEQNKMYVLVLANLPNN